MLSQNQLQTNGYRDSRQDVQVRATNLEEVNYQKEVLGELCHRHQQTLLIDGYEKCLTRYGDYV